MKLFVCNIIKFVTQFILPWVAIFIILPPDRESIKYGFVKSLSGSISGNIVIGDSRSEIGFVDSTGSYTNLSLGGSTPVEGYETLSNLNLSEIDTVIISYSYFHLLTQDCFYRRGIPNNFFSEETEFEIRQLLHKYPNSKYHSNSNINLNSTLFERYFYRKTNRIFKVSRLVNSLKFLFNFSVENINSYGGYSRTIFSKHNICNSNVFTHEIRILEESPDLSEFDPINYYYLNKIFQLLSEKQVYFVEWSRAVNTIDISSKQRKKYLDKISTMDSNVNVIPSVLDLDCSYFYDPDHLNARGATTYSKMLLEHIRYKPM